MSPEHEGCEPVVTFAAVTKTYGLTKALDRVSFAIPRGQMVALLGHNGAGKSTAVDLMLGLRRPDQGTVTVLGGMPARATSAGRVGAMIQDGGLPSGARVGEVVELARRLYGRAYSLEDLLAAAGLTGLIRRRVDQLSGGQAQRVRLAVALAGNPDVLFLDEPTVGFDIRARREFWDNVRQAADEGVTVLFTTHYLDEVDANAARVLVLAQGRLVEDGTPAQIKDRLEQRTISVTLNDWHPRQLWNLPGVTDVRATGAMVQLSSRDLDGTLTALYRTDGLDPIGLRISSPSLEDALIALTDDGHPSTISPIRKEDHDARVPEL